MNFGTFITCRGAAVYNLAPGRCLLSHGVSWGYSRRGSNGRLKGHLWRTGMRALAVALVVLLIAIPASAKDDPRPAQADCKGANLDDPTDPVCGRKEASINNNVAYSYIEGMDQASRNEAELFYLVQAQRCTARAIWVDYHGVSGAEAFFSEISQKQCANEFIRFLRLCLFNNTGKVPVKGPAYMKEFEICWNPFFRGSWEFASGRSPLPSGPDDIRYWYRNEMIYT